eukprot:2705646-Rhodomonas_salina.1
MLLSAPASGESRGMEVGRRVWGRGPGRKEKKTNKETFGKEEGVRGCWENSIKSNARNVRDRCG